MAKLFSKKKSQKIQVDSKAESLFRFSLQIPGRSELDGRLAGLSPENAAIAFPVDTCPEFKPDERLRLILTVIQTGEKLHIDAILKSSSADKADRLCHFEFIDTTNLILKLNPEIAGYFNRRRAFRVKADTLNPVEADVVWEDNSGKGWLIDISTTGIAIGLRKSSARMIENANLVNLIFQLPNSNYEMNIIGRIIHMLPIGNDILCGIDIDKKETSDIRKCEEIISKFVMQRQLDMLRI